MELDGGKCAYASILNPAGGLVGGDRLTLKIRAGSGSRVLLTTPSATRLYRSAGEEAVQTVLLEAGTGSVLEWMPDTVIPYRGSRFDQRLDIRLERGATLMLWDALAAGRIARGERWDFTRFRNEIRVSDGGGGAVGERYDLQPDRFSPSASALGGNADYFASFYIFTPAPMDDSGILEGLYELTERHSDSLRAGVSPLSIPGWAVRVAARTAVDLSRFQMLIWDFVRKRLLGRPAPLLRKG